MRLGFLIRPGFPRTVCALATLSAGIALLAGCTAGTGEFGRTAGTSYISYPPPPDTPRVQFLTTFSNSVDVSGKSGPSLLESLAGRDSESGMTLVKPYGIGVRGSRMYICDVRLLAVVVVDVRDRRFERFAPRGAGQLRRPANCFTDPADGRLYVADMDRNQVVVFDSTLAYVGAFGDHDRGRPTDVFVEGDHVWVADMAGEQLVPGMVGWKTVRVYDKRDFRLLRSFPEPEAEPPAKLFFPTHIYVRDDEVYVTDFGDFQVKVYSREGEFLRSVGSFGRGLGQFLRPKGIAVDPEGILYVVDAGIQNVQMFNREGQLLMFFGRAYSGPGDMYLPAAVTLGFEDLELFEPYVQPGFRLKYLIFVTNQFGPDLINIYGFVEPAGVGADEAP